MCLVSCLVEKRCSGLACSLLHSPRRGIHRVFSRLFFVWKGFYHWWHLDSALCFRVLKYLCRADFCLMFPQMVYFKVFFRFVPEANFLELHFFLKKTMPHISDQNHVSLWNLVTTESFYDLRHSTCTRILCFQDFRKANRRCCAFCVRMIIARLVYFSAENWGIHGSETVQTWSALIIASTLRVFRSFFSFVLCFFMQFDRFSFAHAKPWCWVHCCVVHGMPGRTVFGLSHV